VDQGLLIMQAELFFDARAMGPDGVFGYAELACDGCGAVALADEVEDFQFLIAQLAPVTVAGRRTVYEALGKLGHQALAQVNFPFEYAADGFQECVGVWEDDVAARAGRYGAVGALDLR
jgi:hypothetical protein